MRHVTGIEEPAIIGKFMRSAVYHALRFLKAEGEALMIEVRYRRSFCLKDLYALLKVVVARIKNLSVVVAQ